MKNTSKIETVEEHCKHKDCKYRQKIASGYTTDICAYILFERQARRDPISQCTKYVPKEGRIRYNPYEFYEELE